MIELRLLGSLEISVDGRDVTAALSHQKRLVLITWLALQRPAGPHRRDTLCALLWPESPDDKARTALRQLLSQVRRELGDRALVTEGDLVVRLGVPDAGAEAVALVLVIIVITYFSLVLGELAPKGIALRAPERYACMVAPVIEWLSHRSAALVRVLTASSRAVLAVLGISRTEESPFVTEDEVRYLVSEGAAKGIFEKAEEELVHNVFEFADTIVREIMVPRTVIQSLDVDTPAGEVLRKASEIGHSRIPVHRESIDRPLGTLVIKDLLAAAARGAVPPLTEMVHSTVFVPETAKITALLQEFRRRRQGLALVVDEYGSIVGLVTIEDVIEEIFGRIADESREDEHGWFLSREADGAYVIDGMAPIEEVNERLGLPLEGSTEYQTVAGLLIHTLEAIPTAGTTLDAQGHRWTILETEGPKITKVRVQPGRAR